MKKTDIALAVALAGFATASQAAPKDDTWYIDGKLGWSQYHDTDFYGNSFNKRIGNGTNRNNQLGAGTFVGYQSNKYLGFELGYDWLGHMFYKDSPNNGSFQAQGITLATKLNYLLTDKLDIYTRLGGMVWRTDSKVAYYNKQLGYGNDHDTGVSPLASIGLEYAWTKNWATSLDYQWVNNIGDVGTVGARPDNFMLSIGVSYRFGQDEVAIPAQQIPASVPVAQPKRFTLKSDVLFSFDEAILTPEGQKVLDQLCSKLQSMDSTDGYVIVLGYADHIGSDDYNQKLSHARAKNVVNYLIAKGIPIPLDKISSRGMGKSNPVTGNTCDHVKGRSAVINCLAPDRRVETEVKGVKDIMITPQV